MKASNERTPANFGRVIINSLCYFILAYLTVNFIASLVTSLASLQFQYSTVIKYHKVIFAIDQQKWSGDAVKMLFSVNPLVGTLLSVISLIIYNNLVENNRLFKMYFLWIFIHSVNLTLGTILSGSFVEKGFGYVLMYLYFTDTLRLILTIISAFTMLFVGYFISRKFLFSANTYFNDLTDRNIDFVVYGHIFIPSLLGTLFLMLLKLPEITEDDMFAIPSVMIIITPLLLRYSFYPNFYFHQDKAEIKLDKTLLLLTLFIVAMFRIGLEYGLHINA